MFNSSRRYLRAPIDNAAVRIIPMVSRGKDTTALRIGKYEPFARLHETHHAHGGLPVAYSLIDDPKYIQLELFRRA
jgi:hypothetical protein